MSTSPVPCKGLNFHASGGGAPAIGLTVGAMNAFEVAGIRPLSHALGSTHPEGYFIETVSGTSAGAMSTLPWAHGIPAGQLTAMAVEENFRRHMHLRGHWWDLLRAELFRKVYEKEVPPDGVLGTHKLGMFFEKMVPRLPDNYYLVAVWARPGCNVPVIVTSQGSYLGKQKDGGEWEYELVDMAPLPVHIAIPATGALPGILEPKEAFIGGMQMMLYDGGLVAGAINIEPLLGIWNKPRESIIVLDSSVGTDLNWFDWLLDVVQEAIYAWYCRQCYIPKAPQNALSGCHIIRPKRVFSSLEFGAGEWQKLLTVLAGFRATIVRLEELGLLTGERLQHARQILRGTELNAQFSWGLPKQERARRMIALLADYGLYHKNPSPEDEKGTV